MSFIMTHGTMDKDFYETYIKEHMAAHSQKKFESAVEDGEFVEYHRVGFKSKTDSISEFSNMWFFEICEKGYCPVFVSNINNSSGYSMCLCGLDRDDDNEITLEDLLEEYVLGEKAKKLIKDLLTGKKS